MVVGGHSSGWMEDFYFPSCHNGFMSVPFVLLPPLIYFLKMSLFSLPPPPSPHPLLIKFSSSLFLTHAMPSKAAVYCGWGTVSSNKMGFGLASHPISALIPFLQELMISPIRTWLEPHVCTLKPRSFTLWVFRREAAVTICQLKGFAFEIDCRAWHVQTERGFLETSWVDRIQKTCHSFGLHATVGESSEMSSFYNSEEVIAFSEYNCMIWSRGCGRYKVVKRARNLDSEDLRFRVGSLNLRPKCRHILYSP